MFPESAELALAAAKGDLMTLPHSYGLVLMLTILTMICWGSWANVLKLAKGWRFELLYYDYSLGVGLALVVGVIWNYIVNPQGNPLLLFTGVALIVGAIVVDAIAYRAHAVSRSTAGDRADAAAKRAATWKGIRLSVVGGILMGMFYPLVEIGKTGQNGLGPYAVGFVFSLGVLASVFVFNLYFMRFPIDGPRLRFGDYLKGNWWVHFLGIVGGMVWIAGSLSNFVAASAPRELQVGPAISYAIGQGSTMVGALWGVLVWREFAGGGARVTRLLVLMFALFLTGLGVVSIAPLFAAR